VATSTPEVNRVRPYLHICKSFVGRDHVARVNLQSADALVANSLIVQMPGLPSDMQTVGTRLSSSRVAVDPKNHIPLAFERPPIDAFASKILSDGIGLCRPP